MRGHNFGLCRKCGKTHVHPKGTLGYKHSKEAKLKISKANKGRIYTKEQRDKMSKAHKGKKLSEDHKRKVGLAVKRRWTTNKKYRQRMSEMMSGSRNPNWRGGKMIHEGYIYVLSQDHPRALCMGGSKSKYVPEQILVMEKYLGRYLKPNEVVHHKNRIRTDNRIENLQLLDNSSEHAKVHCPKGTRIGERECDV